MGLSETQVEHAARTGGFTAFENLLSSTQPAAEALAAGCMPTLLLVLFCCSHLSPLSTRSIGDAERVAAD